MALKRLSQAAKKRLRAGRMLRAGNTPAVAPVAGGMARQTVHTWKRLLDEGGVDALRLVAERGRPAPLDKSQLAQVRAAVLQGPTEHGFGTDMWTLKRVGVVIERDEAAVQHWKRRTWPGLKKRPSEKAV